MSQAAFYTEKFEAELNSLIEQSRNTDGLNVAGVLLHAVVRELKACAGNVDDSRTDIVRKMIQEAAHDVSMACYPLPQTTEVDLDLWTERQERKERDHATSIGLIILGSHLSGKNILDDYELSELVEMGREKAAGIAHYCYTPPSKRRTETVPDEIPL